VAEPFRIVFVCTGNTCRSAMAEGALRVLLNKERPGKFEVFSAGIAAATGHPATFYAEEAAKVWDADLSTHSSQPLTPALIDQADLILAMSPEHYTSIVKLRPQAKDKTYLFKSFPELGPVGEGVEDPIGQSLDKYNETFLEIGEYLGRFLPEIVKRIDENTSGD